MVEESIYFEVKLYLPTPARIKFVFSNFGKGLNRISIGMFNKGRPIGGFAIEARIFQLGENPESNPSGAVLIDQKSFIPVSLVPVGAHTHSKEGEHSH